MRDLVGGSNRKKGEDMEKDIDVDIPESPVYCGGCSTRLHKEQILKLLKRGLSINNRAVCSESCKVWLQVKIDKAKECV